MLESPAFQVLATLSPIRRRMAARVLASWMLRGLAGGSIGAALALTFTRIFAPGAGWTVPAVLFVLCCLAGAGLARVYWPSILDAARLVDRHFALRDRMTTALEFEGSSNPIAALQKRDLAGRVSPLRLQDCAPIRPSARDLWIVAIGSALLLLALAVPTSRASHAATTRAADAPLGPMRAAAVAQLHQISRRFSAGLTPQQRRAPAAAKALAVIARLQAQLQRATTQAQALREISQAQVDLRRLNATLHPVNRATGSRLAAMMKRAFAGTVSSKSLSALQHNNAAASKFLQNLAKTAPALDARQKGQVARALARLANQTPDGALRSNFQRAASALGHNDTRSAQSALRHAASRLGSAGSQQAMKAKLAQSSANLNTVKAAINGAHSTDSRAGPGSRAGSSTASGATVQGRAGRVHQGHRPGASTGAGAQQSASQARQGQVGASAAGGQNKAGSAGSDKYKLVYVPGVVARGGKPLPFTLRGAPKKGPVVPYQQVLAQYSQTARSALDRSPLPKSDQEYVRRYFTALSHQ